MSDENEYEYGKDSRKKFIAYVSDHVHAKMIAKMQYDGIKQSAFITAILEAYSEDDPHIRAFVENNDKFKITDVTRRRHAKEKKKIALQEYSLNLEQQEIDQIFDILEDDDD